MAIKMVFQAQDEHTWQHNPDRNSDLSLIKMMTYTKDMQSFGNQYIKEHAYK